MEGFSLHNVERALFTSSSGKLGEITGAVTGAGTVASPWSFALASSPTNVEYSPKKQWFPQDAKIDLYTNAGVYNMTIQIVSATSASANNVSLTAITLQTGSSVTPAALDLLYWAGNKDQEIVGLPDAAPIAAGNLYGISQTTYPKMRGVLSSVSGSLQYDDINDMIELLAEENEAPDLIVCSHRALSLIKNLSEDAKRYNVAEVQSSNAKIGFKGVEAMTSEGPAAIIASQMCQDNVIWFMRKDALQIVMREDFGLKQTSPLAA